MSKYKIYEPYGFEEGSGYVSKRYAIEDELAANRENDGKEFSSVVYDQEHLQFIFKNVKGEAVGLANMSDIIPSDLISSSTYNADSKNIEIIFKNQKIVEIPVKDLIDINEAGNGLINNNGALDVVKDSSSEDFLYIKENSIGVSGIQDSIDEERDRAVSAETKEYNRAVSAETEEHNRAVSAETYIYDLISTETTNRTDSDNRIEAKFDSLLGEAISSSNTVSKQIEDERDARQTQDNNLLANINTKLDKSAHEDFVATYNTFVSNVYTKSDVYTKDDVYTKNESDDKFALKTNFDALSSNVESNYATKAYSDSGDTAILDKIWNSTSNYFETVYGRGNGSYAKLWNEHDGGGSQYYNSSENIISYVGTNDDGADGICVQIYSKNKGTNIGTRINVNPHGAYYGVGETTSTDDENNEIATVGKVKELILSLETEITSLKNRISELESKITALQNNS